MEFQLKVRTNPPDNVLLEIRDSLVGWEKIDFFSVSFLEE